MSAKYPRLGGIVLGSTDPERLWEWYRTAFAPDAKKEGEMLGLELDGTYLIFESRQDVAAKTAEPGRILVNYQVDDIHATAEHLTSVLDVRWIRPVENPSPDGEEPVLLGTVEDPDGNYVQIFQVFQDFS